jgi:hypothetical protein
MKTSSPHRPHPASNSGEELEGHGSSAPESLEDLLRGYDVQKIKTLTHVFRDDAPRGTELI